ncbi:MAG: InlB B-repeat-containing protein [Paludibacteraceae bacterium]|nr:InlB B-repeat-containing protein [Paludibacteraceae bacterium]
MKKIFTLFAALAMVMSMSAAIYLPGSWNGWNQSGNAFSGSPLTSKITLAANTEYKFKVKDGSNWYGNNGTITADVTGWTFSTSEGDCTLKSKLAGVYTFTWDASAHKLSVAYPTEEVVVEYTYTVVGSSAPLFGKTWDPTYTANDMKKEGDVYTLTKTDVTLSAGSVEYKVAREHAWGTGEYPSNGNKTFTIETAGVYDVTFTYDGGSNLTATPTLKQAEEVIPVVSVKGSWDEWALKALTLADNKLTAAATINIAAGSYKFGVDIDGVFTANGATVSRQSNAIAGLTGNTGDLTLTADVAGDYVFTWTFETNTLTVTYPELPTYTVSVTAENGTVEGAGTYKQGETVTLVATANEGYEFVNWTAGETVVSTENPYKFTVTADVALVANFKLITLHKVLAGEDLQAAVNKANSGDTVLVQAGTYEGNFTMKDGVYVSGGWNADFTAQAEHASILDAKENGRVLNQAEDFKTVTIWDNFTIQNGKLTAADGVKNLGAGVALMKKGRVINCLIQNNTFTYSGTCIGGGIGQDVGDRNDTCAINCIVRNNVASHGGGVRIRGVILNSVIEYNKTTTNAAGGMHLQGGAAYNCIIRYNESLKDLGGVRLYGGCDLVNCLIVGNKSAGKVGGVQAGEGNAASNIINCTIAGNEQAATGGDTIYCGLRSNNNNATQYNGKFFVNNVVYGNKVAGEVKAEQVHEHLRHYATNGKFVNNALQGTSAALDTLGTVTYIHLSTENNPQFTENYGIAWTSPLYNAGNNDVVDKILGGKDVYGNARKQGANIEIGAVELTEYKATIEIGEGGALEVDYTGEKTPLVAGEISLPAGFTTKLYVTPAANYALETITLNGEALEAVEGVYTIPAVTGDITLVAKFQEAAVAATITWELNGGEFPTVEVPTNEELWGTDTADVNGFMHYYNHYYGLTRATQTIENVASFAYAQMQQIMTDEASAYKWLGDYVQSVATAAGKPLSTDMAAANESGWRWSVWAFFNACEGKNGSSGIDFTEAGKPENWGSAYKVAHGAVELPTEPVEEDYVLPTPTREGYTFVGWYDNAEGEGEAMTVLPAGWAGTLYAIWKVEGPATALENIAVEGKAVKAIINGQLVIIKNGVQYNAQGAILK